MVSPLLGVKEFVIHYGGKWGRTIPRKINTSEYKGGKQESVKYDGDEICWLDLEKDVHKLVGEGVEFQIANLIKGNLCRITEDKHLMDMWGPNGEPMIFDISDAEETAELEARDELTENVVEEHIEPDELNEYNNDHGDDVRVDVVRVDVDEEFNHGGSNTEKARYEYGQTFGPVFGTWMDAGYDSSSQESDDEDYCPVDSEYSDNELGNDIDAMMVDDEVKNLEEELQGTVLGNFMQGTTNVFEAEEMAKVADPVEASKRYCFRHMYKNFKKVFSGKLWENLAWGAAKAYKQQELIRILGVINKTNSKALDWLDTEPRSCWARAYFDWISKYDKFTNNFSESFNSWILKIRDKPLVNFLDKYNLDLLQLAYGKRELSMSLITDDVVPNVLFMIKKRELRYNWYEIKGVLDVQYLAINRKTGTKYNVDIAKLECSCIEWQMSRVPYVHAIAVLRSRRPQYCNPYFSVEAFRATYATYLYPIDNIEDWPEIDNIEELILPPENTRKAGRPKKQRIRGEDEPLKTHRKCAKCGTPGHNTLTCDVRKKGVHGKRKKPQDQGAQYHNEAATAVAQEAPLAAAAQAVPATPPMQLTPDLPEPANKRGRKRRNDPMQKETPVAPTQGGRGRAPRQDEVQHDAAPAQAQGGRGRSKRPRGPTEGT
ncbi:hypothetical protein IFM89_016161 [Coptis chinensis]|uniref:SWIM-type domain-containing protein n=1 Tax=Coptis chinensis TaxID=261450 RepID=A0A835LIT6_9MAGN|nr:hypothetical protein IFM89_016161 [Coptis chinensis]